MFSILIFDQISLRCWAATVSSLLFTDNILILFSSSDIFKMLNASYIAPVVMYLCHEECEANGDVFECGAGWVAQGMFTWPDSQKCNCDPGLNMD